METGGQRKKGASEEMRLRVRSEMMKHDNRVRIWLRYWWKNEEEEERDTLVMMLGMGTVRIILSSNQSRTPHPLLSQGRRHGVRFLENVRLSYFAATSARRLSDSVKLSAVKLRSPAIKNPEVACRITTHAMNMAR
eukprot:754875-Hanusia_phi.AAC.1